MAVGGVLGWVAGRLVPGLVVRHRRRCRRRAGVLRDGPGNGRSRDVHLVDGRLAAAGGLRRAPPAPGRRPWLNVLAGGVIAAVISGVAFYVIFPCGARHHLADGTTSRFRRVGDRVGAGDSGDQLAKVEVAIAPKA